MRCRAGQTARVERLYGGRVKLGRTNAFRFSLVGAKRPPDPLGSAASISLFSVIGETLK